MMAAMSGTVDPELLETAVSFLRKAGEFTLQHFGSDDLAIDRKGDGTPVTVADRGAERLLREEIEAQFPDDGILGEEEAEKVGTSGRRWIIDPIDGTKAFTHGVPLYSNLLAVEETRESPSESSTSRPWARPCTRAGASDASTTASR